MREEILRLAVAVVLTAGATVVSADGTAGNGLSAPVNLGFEETHDGDAGAEGSGLQGPGFAPGPPSGWYEGTGPLGFEVGTDDDRPYQGLRSATVRRGPGRREGEAAGSLCQRIDAGSVRGKTVRLRAAVRAETADPEGAAHLVLRVSGSGLETQDHRRADTGDRPIRDPEWHLYEITLEVPDEAEELEYGVALAGTGQAWFDAVELEEVVSSLPPTCLPPTVPNCGLLYDCPASAHCCSRWEGAEYCCKVPPINGAVIDDGGKGVCLPPAQN